MRRLLLGGAALPSAAIKTCCTLTALCPGRRIALLGTGRIVPPPRGSPQPSRARSRLRFATRVPTLARRRIPMTKLQALGPLALVAHERPESMRRGEAWLSEDGLLRLRVLFRSSDCRARADLHKPVRLRRNQRCQPRVGGSYPRRRRQPLRKTQAGPTASGTVFTITRLGDTLTVLPNFTGGTDRTGPMPD